MGGSYQDKGNGTWESSDGKTFHSQDEARAYSEGGGSGKVSGSGGDWGAMSGLGGTIASFLLIAVKIVIFLYVHGILQCAAIGAGVAFAAGIFFTIITGMPFINNITLWSLAAVIGFVISFIAWKKQGWGVVILAGTIGLVGYLYLFLAYNGIVYGGADVPGQNVIARTNVNTQLRTSRSNIDVKSGDLVNVRGPVSENRVPIDWKPSYRSKTRKGTMQTEDLRIKTIDNNTMAIITDTIADIDANLLSNMPLFNRTITTIAKGDTVRVIESHNSRYEWTKVEVAGKKGWIKTNSFLFEDDPNLPATVTADGVQISGSINNFAYEVNDAGSGIIITKYLKLSAFGKKVIPAEINGLPIVRIAGPLFVEDFSDSEKMTLFLANIFGLRLKSVVIPDTVTYISDLIDGCEKVKQLTLPSGLITIGKNAFTGSGLKSITIPASVTEIGSRAFANNKNLQTVTITGERITIAADAFEGCSKLSNDSIKALRNAGYTGDLAEVTTGSEIKIRGGHLYAGDFLNGKPHGKGKLIYKNGNVYEGDFVNGKRSGYGVIKYDGAVYEGEWLNDKRNGKGTYTWTSGNVYEGEYANNEMHGKGKFSWADGNVYEGDYVKGKRTGIGKATFTSGTVYDGRFKNGKFLGPVR